MAQEAGFKLGANYDSDVYPQDIPNIRLYIGSASDTGSNFYAKYKEGTKQMLAGNTKYFVADATCEVPMHPTVCGKPVSPLLSQSEVDRKMRENEIAANREYYNIFDHFDLEDCVVSRSDIFSATETFVPHTHWGGKKHKYIIAYDPASKNDNAPVVVMEIFKDDDKQICGRFVHMENLLITYGDGSKRPMRLDEQVNRLREMIYEYNGKGNIPPYENVTVLLDAGAAGQSYAIAQELIKPWTDSQGKTHPGIYDEEDEDCVRWAEGYKGCISGCIKMVEPRKYRNLMFEATKLLVPQKFIRFAPPPPKYDTLVLDDGSERKLGKAEIASLVQMELMKEEMISMVRIKNPTTGNITYALPPEKRNKMHDDRNYVAVMCCWWIGRLREDETFGETSGIDYTGFFDKKKSSTVDPESVKDPWLKTIAARTVGNVKRSPFTGKSPFRR